MTSNVGAFNREVRRRNRELTQDELVRRHRQLAQLAVRRIVLRTPVDTGRTRGNWQATTDAPAGGVLDRIDKSGAVTINAASSSIVAIQPFSVWWFANNVPHILVLENGGFVPADPGPSKDPRPDRRGRVLVRGGFSVQASQGMVGVTFLELSSAFAAA